MCRRTVGSFWDEARAISRSSKLLSRAPVEPRLAAQRARRNVVGSAARSRRTSIRSVATGSFRAPSPRRGAASRRRSRDGLDPGERRLQSRAVRPAEKAWSSSRMAFSSPGRPAQLARGRDRSFAVARCELQPRQAPPRCRPERFCPRAQPIVEPDRLGPRGRVGFRAERPGGREIGEHPHGFQLGRSSSTAAAPGAPPPCAVRASRAATRPGPRVPAHWVRARSLGRSRSRAQIHGRARPQNPR